MEGFLDERAEPEILYEDDSVLVARKPSGMNSAPLRGGGPSLCGWLFERRPRAAEAAPPRGEVGALAERPRQRPRQRQRVPGEGGLLHRLDRETSGAVVFALTREAFASLLEAQDAGSFRKEYLALAAASPGFFPEGSRPARSFPRGIGGADWMAAAGEPGRAALLIEEAVAAGSRPLVAGCFRPYGRHAARVACAGTEEVGAASGPRARALVGPYESSLLGAEALRGAVLLRLGIAKGFRHQIRAHLAWIGLPILGDRLYGGLGDGRLRLHAARVAFPHPLTGDELVVDC